MENAANSSGPRNLALVYILVAGAWIITSDLLLGRATSDVVDNTRWDVAKGLLFVAVTGAILYQLARRMQQKLLRAEAERHAALQEAHAQLADSEARYRALFEGHRSVMLVVDPEDGRILDANSAAATFYGWTREELRSRRIDDINTVSPDRVRDKLGRTVAADAERHIFKHRLAHGEVREVEVRAAPITVRGRTVLYSIIRDVAEELRAAERLRLLATAAEAASDAIIVADPLGTIEWANPAFTTMTGYTLEEAIGRSTNLLKSGEQPPDFYQALWNRVSTGATWSGELQNRRRDGRTYWEHMIITPVVSRDGAIEHYVAIKRDVTELRTMQRQMARGQRMESIGALAAGIAHDLNNVLTPILMTADLLMLQERSADDVSSIAMVRQAALRGGDIVRQVLAFARGVEGQRAVVAPDRILKELAQLLRRTLPPTIKVELSAEAGVPPVFVDATQIHQVLLNLAVNARDAMPDGGLLKLGLRRLAVDHERITESGLLLAAGDYVEFAVHDSGSGMSPEVIETIFEPFFTTKEVGKGTGLGLATAVGIIRSHGGGLDVVSEPGRGSTFQVSLPVAGDQSEPVLNSRPDAIATLRGHGQTVLVADDEEAVRLVTRNALRLQGFEVVEAVDGAEGLTMFEADPSRFSVALVDLSMPRVTGDTVAKRIRQLRPELPIILMSGQPSNPKLPQTPPSQDQEPWDVLLKKPFSRLQLIDSVSSVFSRLRPIAGARR